MSAENIRSNSACRLAALGILKQIVEYDPFSSTFIPVEQLVRAHSVQRSLAPASGRFRDIPNRRGFFDEIAVRSADGRRVVIKAVNYERQWNILHVRLQGERLPEKALGTLPAISAGLADSASLEHPDAIAPARRPLTYAREFSLDLESYPFAVIEFQAA